MRIALIVIFAIKQPLPALFELNAEIGKQLVHLLTAHAVVFCNLRYGHEALVVEDNINIVCFGLQFPDDLFLLGVLQLQRLPFLSLFFERGEGFNCELRVVEKFIDSIGPVFVDRGKDFVRDPPFKLFCLWLVGTEDDVI